MSVLTPERKKILQKCRPELVQHLDLSDNLLDHLQDPDERVLTGEEVNKIKLQIYHKENQIRVFLEILQRKDNRKYEYLVAVLRRLDMQGAATVLDPENRIITNGRISSNGTAQREPTVCAKTSSSQPPNHTSAGISTTSQFRLQLTPTTGVYSRTSPTHCIMGGTGTNLLHPLTRIDGGPGAIPSPQPTPEERSSLQAMAAMMGKLGDTYEQHGTATMAAMLGEVADKYTHRDTVAVRGTAGAVYDYDQVDHGSAPATAQGGGYDSVMGYIGTPPPHAVPGHPTPTPYDPVQGYIAPENNRATPGTNPPYVTPGHPNPGTNPPYVTPGHPNPGTNPPYVYLGHPNPGTNPPYVTPGHPIPGTNPPYVTPGHPNPGTNPPYVTPGYPNPGSIPPYVTSGHPYAPGAVPPSLLHHPPIRPPIDHLQPSGGGPSRAGGDTESNREDEGFIDIDLSDGIVSDQWKVFCADRFYKKHKKESYKMHKYLRGKALIINVRRVKGQERREGTDIDRDNLRKLWSELHFEPVVVEDQPEGENLTAEIIENTVKGFSQDPAHKQAQCCVVCILTHGNNGVVYGTDGNSVKLEKLFDYFNNAKCPELALKPKLFFTQACRGGKMDAGVLVDPRLVDAADDLESRPVVSDFLYGYPTQEGYRAFCNRKTGSWYVEALTRVFLKYSAEEDICTLLNMVGAVVAKRVTKDTGRKDMEDKSQSPVYECCFIHKPKFYFFPGIQQDKP